MNAAGIPHLGGGGLSAKKYRVGKQLGFDISCFEHDVFFRLGQC